MGAWTTKIFDDDGAMDIIGEYKILLGYGVPPLDAYQKIENYFLQDYQGEDDEDVYWLSVALYQWQNGILMDNVKQKALECIDNETYLERWKDSGEKVYKKRKQILEQLRYNLVNIVNPEKKKFPKCPKYYRFKTEWKIGDLLIYKMTSPILEWGESVQPKNKERFIKTQKMIESGFLLLRVVKISKIPVSDICPDLDYSSSAVVMLYDWLGDVLPTENEIAQLKFRPFVNNYWGKKKTLVSSICLEVEDLKKAEKWCGISLFKTEEDYQIPKMYAEHSISPLRDISQFDTVLIPTFALEESDEVEWYSDPDWLNDSNGS